MACATVPRLSAQTSRRTCRKRFPRVGIGMIHGLKNEF
jgi:hypothetical protein